MVLRSHGAELYDHIQAVDRNLNFATYVTAKDQGGWFNPTSVIYALDGCANYFVRDLGVLCGRVPECHEY